jgi:DNA polymerase (family 10)
LLLHAREQARVVVAHLARHPAVAAVEVAGEVRRWSETVAHIDVVVATDDPAAVRAHLDAGPRVATPVTLHTAPPAEYGTLLVLATGPEAHWQALAGRLTSAEARDEASFYAAVGLPWIPPEARDASLAAPPRLVERGDVRGAVHCHTTWSDGTASVEDMARAAMALGLDYLTITDHSGTAGYAGGLDLERLRKQWDEIDEVQTRVPIRLLKGTESDILADGALDWPDEILERLDVVIASVHQRYKLDPAKATARLVRTMKLPIFKIWGHPLGRMLLSRDPIACDVDAVLDAAAAAPVAIELNGDPHRLDFAPEHARAAHARGIPFVISCDAHSTAQLDYIEYAVHMARRAGLAAGDVLNTLPVEAFAARVRPTVA